MRLPEPGDWAFLRTGEYVLTRPQVSAFVVALASHQDKAEQVSASLARKALEQIAVKHGAKVAKEWEQASTHNLTLLIKVLGNNPGKTPAQIAQRPDVAAALSDPYIEAAARSEQMLKDAWDEAVADTTKRVKAELKLMGAQWAGGEPDTDVLAHLLGDLHANAGAMQQRFLAAMENRDTFSDRAKSLARDAALRARYSSTVAVWSAATSVRRDAFAKAGFNAMWVSRLDDRTCTNCRNLHGTVVAGPKKQFPKKGLKVYRGVLHGPPLHPSCRCILVATKKQPKN